MDQTMNSSGDDTPGEPKVNAKSYVCDSADFRQLIKDMGPSMIDASLRQSIWMFWMSLPEGKHDIASFKQIVRERYERILSEIESDMDLFEIKDLAASISTGAPAEASVLPS